MNDYEDIINLPHHISQKHPQMSLEARSAQFAPFAALTGYEEVVKETERITVEKIELDEEEKSILNEQIQYILSNIDKKIKVCIKYFVPDIKKDGGQYIIIKGIVSKIDKYKQIIVVNNIEINIKDIIKIEME